MNGMILIFSVRSREQTWACTWVLFELSLKDVVMDADVRYTYRSAHHLCITCTGILHGYGNSPVCPWKSVLPYVNSLSCELLAPIFIVDLIMKKSNRANFDSTPIFAANFARWTRTIGQASILSKSTKYLLHHVYVSPAGTALNRSYRQCLIANHDLSLWWSHFFIFCLFTNKHMNILNKLSISAFFNH